MTVDLFAGIPVRGYMVALSWYEQLLGSAPSFIPSPTDAVWELAEHRFLVTEERPDTAGYAIHTIFVDDLDALVTEISLRGLEPTEREMYANGVRKAT